MRAYHPTPESTDDYSSVRVNGMWYQPWQSGYDDILKHGVPRPTDKRTILAELHSPHVPDFLHGGGSGEVPFLVTERARSVLEKHRLTGFDFAPVLVAKIATKGKRTRGTRGGEPEDSILKARGISLVEAPILFAVYVVGRVDVLPDQESGRHPSGCVAPFQIVGERAEGADLWRPQYRGVAFSAWAFCSDQFRSVCVQEGLSNIQFESFESFMEAHHMAANKRLQGMPQSGRP
ncbi:MAG: hypothetical protein HOP22_06505 [Nitrospiraceae bacterium]|nr:hypothetical protein [Nitrospiraceae bacterium]